MELLWCEILGLPDISAIPTDKSERLMCEVEFFWEVCLKKVQERVLKWLPHAHPDCQIADLANFSFALVNYLPNCESAHRKIRLVCSH